jgi:hypothetical protein
MAGNRPTGFNSLLARIAMHSIDWSKPQLDQKPFSASQRVALAALLLPAREGKFVLKYFMLRRAARVQRWKRLRPRA